MYKLTLSDKLKLKALQSEENRDLISTEGYSKLKAYRQLLREKTWDDVMAS